MTTESEQQTGQSLGERIREGRRARGLSQDALAQPEFTKSYISAIELGRARPSLRALALLAGRLGIAMSTLLAAEAPRETAPDLAILEEDLAYQIDCARRAIDTGQPSAAIQLLDTAEREYSASLSQLSVATRYRFYHARAAAAIRLGLPVDAQRDLAIAGDLADRLPAGAEARERVRNALGATYYLQDQPHLAIEAHLQCLHAIQTGVVQDLNLRLLIYSNLANDYLVLNEMGRALSTYKEALTLLDEVSNLERQAGIYWGLSLAYKAQGDLAWATLYAQRALSIHEAGQNQIAAAQMQVNLAELLIARQDYGDAEQQLERALRILTPAGDPLLLSRLYEHRTMLALGRDQLPEAAAYAQQSLDLSAAIALAAQDPGTRANTVRTQVRALHVAALVSERQGQVAAADQHFQRAVTLAEEMGSGQTSYEIQLAYAEVLAARGDHQQAGQYYRDAARQRFRPARW